MCFMNCPYESYAGECTIGRPNKPLDGYCQDPYETDGLDNTLEDELNE